MGRRNECDQNIPLNQVFAAVYIVVSRDAVLAQYIKVTCNLMKIYYQAAQQGLSFGPITLLWAMLLVATIGNISEYDSDLLGGYPIAKPLALVAGGAIGLIGVGSVFGTFVNGSGVSKSRFLRNIAFMVVGLITLWFGLYKEVGFSLEAILLLYLPSACTLHFLYLHVVSYSQTRNKFSQATRKTRAC